MVFTYSADTIDIGKTVVFSLDDVVVLSISSKALEMMSVALEAISGFKLSCTEAFSSSIADTMSMTSLDKLASGIVVDLLVVVVGFLVVVSLLGVVNFRVVKTGDFSVGAIVESFVDFGAVVVVDLGIF